MTEATPSNEPGGFSPEFLQRVYDFGLTSADLVGWTEETLDSGLFGAASHHQLNPRQLGAWMKEFPGDPDRVWQTWADNSVEGRS